MQKRILIHPVLLCTIQDGKWEIERNYIGTPRWQESGFANYNDKGAG